MCGIAGLFRPLSIAAPRSAMLAAVDAMTGAMVHRGPDADGRWIDRQDRCALGHRRLSIIDTSAAGRQPMTSGDGRWVISFNGEIYNFQEVRQDLAAAGVRLRGRTDTEVLIEAVALWGVAALQRLDGQYAFAAYDTRSGDLLLARDPFGEKPLYYTTLPGGLVAFASELQALERLPGFDFTVTAEALSELIAFQYIGAPRTIYAATKKLPPGCWVGFDAEGRTRSGRHFAFRPGQHGFDDRPLHELADELEEILVRSLRRRMIADVPLGAFLSGGVDSSTACALVRRQLDMPLNTYSIGFDGDPDSEHWAARAFAEHLGTRHHDRMMAPETKFLHELGLRLDEPNADSSCQPTYLLSRFVRQHVTVAISGDGGDEMFGGYGRYFSTIDEAAVARAAGNSEWRPGSAYYGVRILPSIEPHVEELLGEVPGWLRDHLGGLRDELDASGDRLFCAMRRSDVENYMPGAVLPKVDRMSMQCSLEVRTPFLSREVAAFAERLPNQALYQGGGRGKLVLREIAYRYLPRELVDRPKQGFGLPMSDWARANLLEVASGLVEHGGSRLSEALGSERVGRFMTRQRTPGQFWPYQVWCVAMLEAWLRCRPAKLPELAPRTFRRASSLSSSVQRAMPVANQLFLVSTAATCDPISDPQTEIPEKLRTLVDDLIRQNGESERAGDEGPIELPRWSEPMLGIGRGDAQRLRGATLLFIETDALRGFDFRACADLRALGVSAVAFRHPSEPDHAVLFRLGQRKSRRLFSRMLPLLVRWVVATALHRTSPLIRVKRLERSIGHLYVSGTIRTIEAIPDRDLSLNYLVFEGTRQLIPADMTRDGVRPGQGTYSIVNQKLMVVPAGADDRDRSGSYWIVRNTPKMRARFDTGIWHLPETSTRTVTTVPRPTPIPSFRPAPGD